MSDRDGQTHPTTLYRCTQSVDTHDNKPEPETVIAPLAPEPDLEGHLKSVYRWSWDVNSNPVHVRARQQQNVRIGRSESEDMPTPTAPAPDDGDHVTGPPTEKQSKFAQIMNCLFRKNTDVVDMKTEAAKSAAKKQTLLVDRSERSRRVLKMERLKAAPTARQMNGHARQTSPSGARKRFLPSENPSAALMTYLGPQNRALRRACSEQVRTSTTSTKPLAREAFNHSSRTLTRNTDYRANRVTERPVPTGKQDSTLGPWLTVNNTSRPEIGNRLSKQNDGTIPRNGRKHKKQMAVVPGVLGADDEMYNSDDEIRDLHDEMSRMNLSHPDITDDQISDRNRKREGSISLPDGGDSDVDGDPGVDRPSNKQEPFGGYKIHRIPTAMDLHDTDIIDTNNNGTNNTMEQVIDDLYTQTQNKLDNIYQTGIESIASISQSATPDMDKFEAQYMNSHLVTDSGKRSKETVLKHNEQVNGVGMTELTNETDVRGSESNGTTQQRESNGGGIDSLLDDVSDWAKDRQNWLLDQPRLGDERYGTESDICISAVINANSDTTGSARQSHQRDEKSGRDSTSTFNQASLVDIDRMGAENPIMNTFGSSDNAAHSRRISGIRESTEQKCNKWVESNTDDAKTVGGGILTGATLFRSASRGSEKRRTMDNVHKLNPESGNDGAYTTLPRQMVSKRTHRGVQIIDYSGATPTESSKERGVEHAERKDNGVMPWTKDTYNFTPRTLEDRTTINDSPSDLGGGVPFRARSPDSWISSCVSPSFMDKVGKKSHAEDLDTFDTDLFGKNPPVIRQTAKIHVPFRGLDREATPMPSDSSHVHVPKHSSKNQQMNPLFMSPMRKEVNRSDSIGRAGNQAPNVNGFNEIDKLSNLPSLPTLRKDDILTSMLNHNENNTYNKARPGSDIPIRPNASSIRQTRDSASSNQKVNVGEQFMSEPRPYSEKLAPKRAESLRIGMGNITATDTTKDRNRPAKQFANVPDTSQRLQYTHSFHENDRNTRVHANTQDVATPSKPKVFESSVIAGVSRGDKLNRTSSIHSKHGLPAQVTGFPSIPQTMDMSTTQDGVQHTAERFKKLMGRRDQGISWMMKDAAETEV